MEAPNIQLFNLFRYDLHLSNGKSLEFMNILDKEYKSWVKEDLAALRKDLNEGFQKIDARFAIQDNRLDSLDKKIDIKISDLRGDLRTEIHNAKNETNRYILGIFLAILLSFLALFLKK
jgi:hypothetical protein